MESFEIRVCKSCGLRYPILAERARGTRCPICMGETRVAHKGNLFRERTPTLASSSVAATRKINLAVLLDNIRSAWNVGSILRSAEGFGFARAYLCGITPTPESDAVQKTSLGAEDSVSWSYHKDAVKLVKGLKKEGWKVFGLEENEKALSINEKKKIKNDAVLIVGNEIAGVDPGLLKLCDQVLFIPMRGEKKSFNVAVAFGIAAQALTASS